MHVSPFMQMEQVYELEAGAPDERLRIAIASHQDGRQVFDARLALRRRELNGGQMTRILLRYPFSGAVTLARIYAHALRMWLGGVPHHPHPGRREPTRHRTRSTSSAVTAPARLERDG
jgi:DUF1365 family protein